MTSTKGQIEDRIAKEVAGFYAKTIGVGPRETRAYIVEDMVILRLQGKLLPFEQKLLEGKDGVNLVKSIRTSLLELLTHHLGPIITSITNHKVISSHGDISTKTGERIEIFVLDTNYENELAQ